MDRFLAHAVDGKAVLGLEGLVRTALFQTGAAVVGYLLQTAADWIDAAYQPPAGKSFKAKVPIQVHGLIGSFTLKRNYYYSRARGGHYPADEALGLEGGHTPALVRLACGEGADEAGFDKAEQHLRETGGIHMDARQIHRLIQRVGPAAQAWQQRDDQPGSAARPPVPIMYVSADGIGIPMRKKELEERAGKQADGTAKTRQVYLGCVFTQHNRDERAARCEIGNPPHTFPAWKAARSLAPCCGTRRCAEAWRTRSR